MKVKKVLSSLLTVVLLIGMLIIPTKAAVKQYVDVEVIKAEERVSYMPPNEEDTSQYVFTSKSQGKWIQIHPQEARGIETKCLHLEVEEGCSSHYGAVSYPIYQTATYAHPGVGKSTGYDYSRLQNPTREHLEKIVASLENGLDTLAFSTGMAAITLMMELFHPGDHLIVDADLYGGA